MAKNYAALADTVKIEDITSDEPNQEILRKLKNNDESFDKLYILSDATETNEYIPIDGEDIGWLGYYIGQNTNLQGLYFYETIDNESFFKEMCCNTTIKNVHFNGINVLVGQVISMLGTFFKNNHNLIEIKIEDCDLGADGIRQLSLAIGNCNKSLSTFEFVDNEIRDEQLVDIITALSMHPKLEKLIFVGMSISRNECTALATLLRCNTTQLKALYLCRNNIDDEGAEVLVNALVNLNQLRELDLSQNGSITIRGWKAFVTLLEMPDSKLGMLSVHGNNIGDDGALLFANALHNNTILKSLDLDTNSITAEGWKLISRLLCDTSTVNKTYLSNHTLLTVVAYPIVLLVLVLPSVIT